MQIQWWQSIRGRLGLGSALLALLTTTMLALTAIAVINYYYGVDQRNSLSDLANEKALYMDKYFVQYVVHDPKSNFALFTVGQMVLKASLSDAQQYWMIVLNSNGIPVYPSFPNSKPPATPTMLSPASLTATAVARKLSAERARSTALALGTPLAALRAASQEQTKARANQARNARLDALKSILQLVNPSGQSNDFEKFQQTIESALASKYFSSDEQFGRDNPFGSAQPFSVRPISAGTQVVGVLVVTPRSNVVPPFVTTVGLAVLIASAVVTVLAACAAIVFSRPITMPLAKLTAATRQLTEGDYSVQVSTEAPGELGELARNFNEMAAQLKRDVDELQRQEIWRRELIMNITHDLATPLTAIAGLGEALIDGVNHTREDYESTGRVIVRETLRLHRLVRDLHVMAKLEAEAIQPKKKAVRLAALIDEALAVLAAEFERCGVEPVNAVAYDLIPVQADADLLTRVFSNLCSNSLRHTPPGGYVIIEATEHSGWLVVSVTDTGEGILAEALSRVFERFYRADSSRQSSTGGSGLGLAIVRAIIEAHGGTAWVENVPGSGARVSFTLPLRADAQDSLSEAPTLPLTKRSIRASQKKQEGTSLKGLQMRKFAR